MMALEFSGMNVLVCSWFSPEVLAERELCVSHAKGLGFKLWCYFHLRPSNSIHFSCIVASMQEYLVEAVVVPTP